ncbi:hypothetical protein RUM44_006103 [Polyplax serrata]|uniref:Uncharacterized protein n=1 Tax=Polyplax serrata TaxID=468196 RepID=A0ABR1AZ37_POLSC
MTLSLGLEIMRGGDFKSKSEILNKIEGTVYFSKSSMKFYSEKDNELQIIKKKENHVLAAVNSGKHLE